MPPNNPGSLNARPFVRACLMLLHCSTAALLLLPHRAHANNLGLVGYWSFNEGTSTQATDFSGNGNTGTLNSIANPPTATSGWRDGKRGKALNFDGSNDDVLVPSASELEPASTISFGGWIYIRSSTAGTDDVIFGTMDASNGYGLTLNNDFNGCAVTSIGAFVAEGGDWCVSYTTFTTSTWYHVMATYNGETILLYVNGVQVGSDTGPSGAISHSGEVFCFGDRAGGGACAGDPFSGTIDEVRVYNRVLGPAEVLKLYQSGAVLNRPPNNLGLVGYWSFDEGTSTIATDFSGTGNHATTTNGPAWVNGKRGKALLFDGSNTYVSAPSSASLHPTSAVTVSAWVRANTWANDRRIVATGDTVTGYELLSNGRSLLSWYVENVTEIDGPLPSTGEWHHIVGSYTGSTNTLYIDGVVAAFEGASGGINPTTNNLFIGASSADGPSTDHFDGLIDEVRIYNRGLSATEVAKLYGSGAVKFTTNSSELDNGSSLEKGLVGHWTFDGPDVTTTVTDRSGQNNHGYFNGGATSSAKAIGKLGQALVFDNTDDYVEVANQSSLNFTNAVTLAAWVKKRSSHPPDTMTWSTKALGMLLTSSGG